MEREGREEREVKRSGEREERREKREEREERRDGMRTHLADVRLARGLVQSWPCAGSRDRSRVLRNTEIGTEL